MKKTIEDLKKMGISLADILLPTKSYDMTKWAVIACDQFSSDRTYWQDVKEIVGNSPSTLNLIFPECYLEDVDAEERIKSINKSMKKYIDDNIFEVYKDCFILLERKEGESDRRRLGLILALDLDEYSYKKDSRSLIRATEGTIEERIPPRKKIRKDAPLELPHIMVLISDKKRQIIEKLYAKRDKLTCLYDFELMKGSGAVKAWLVNSEEDLSLVRDGFKNLYDKLDPNNKLLFAMGDGNHSFATAKSVWEDVKVNLTEKERKENPAKYCLVEIENIFDEGLIFEPIHRVFFNLEVSKFEEALKKVDAKFKKEEFSNKKDAIKLVNKDGDVRFVLVKDGKFTVYSLDKKKALSAPRAIQTVIEDVVLSKKLGKVDYTHGIDASIDIAKKAGDAFAILMPNVSKDNFFATIEKAGAFPRKTFSIGEDIEKRFYIESRKIKK